MFNLSARSWLWSVVVVASHISSAAAYAPDERWSVTASGTTGAAGTPITLTWSIAPDGTTIPGEDASNLISHFDDLFNVTSGGSDLTQRRWFTYFEQSFDRWSELGGITFVYEPHDNGAQLQSSSGALGVRGDVRIGGAFVDGPSGTLAYTWLPNSGDVVVDTGETNYYSNPANNYRQLRNTIMHELGHTFGLLHIESSTDNLLMEPTINLGIDGPQLDDIRGIQGMYGDAFEKTNAGLGNGTYQRATSLGALSANNTLAIGSDAVGDQSVGSLETDFVSVANNSDVDFYSFTLAAPTLLDATLTPLGGVFSQGVEGGPQSMFDANARNDLSLSIFASNGTTLLGSANLTPAGGSEFLADLELTTPGTYYARITGSLANVQLYELKLSAALLSIALPGDYNRDGTVDAADYVIWRKTDGTPAGYNLWRDSFGRAVGGGGSLSNATVAEPAAAVLLVVGVAIGFWRLTPTCLVSSKTR